MRYASELAQRALNVAKRQMDFKEKSGRNDGWLPRLVQRYIAKGQAWLDNQPWCVCYAIYCVHKAANELTAEIKQKYGSAAKGVASRLPYTASSSSLWRWAKAEDAKMRARRAQFGLDFVPVVMLAPEPGCIGLVKGGPTGHRHTFLVHEVRNGEVIGVDGNYRNAVSWSHRKIGECDYIRIV